MDKLMRYDIHGHCIIEQLIPDAIFSGRWAFSRTMITQLAKKSTANKFLSKSLLFLYNLFTRKNIALDPILDLYLGTTENYLDFYKKEMKKSGIDKSVIHMIDMDFAFGANTLMSYEDQLQFYLNLNTDPNFISFLGVDLRRDDRDVKKVFKLAAKYKCGIKLYPPLGFNIDDYKDKLYWALAQESKTPILMHGSKGGIGKFTKYSHPSNLLNLLFNFPELHWCVAHAGGEFTKWTEILTSWFMDFPYLFVDTAFHSDAYYRPEWYFQKLAPAIDKHPTKYLIGSDFLLFTPFYSYSNFFDLYRYYLKKYQSYEFDQYNCISSYNPEAFLEGIL